MSSQPASGDQWVNISAAGTTVASNTNATLKRIVLAGTYVGSVEFYDSATAAGTAASNKIYDLGLPLLNQYKNIDVNARVRNGLVYVATGTPIMTFTWD